MKIVVIIPTYNEKVNIEKMIPVLEKEVFPKIKDHDMQILIADDKSPDGTADVVRDYMKEYKNLHLLQGNKEGLGAAYVRAMRHAMEELHADAVVEFDADFQHDPHDIPRLVEVMDKGADYVIGSRYIKGGKIPKEWGFYRKFISFVGGSMFARVVLMIWNIHDVTSGLKLTKTKYLEKVDLEHLYSKYYAYKIHILHDIVHMGAKVKEVPIIFYERKEGSSKIERKDLFDSFYVVIKLRVHDSASFFKFLCVGGTGFVVNFILLKILVDGGHWNPFFANLAGAVIAIFWNYNLNNFWTFKENKVSGVATYLWKLLQFYATSAFGVIFIQSGTIYLGDTFIGQNKIFHLLFINVKYYLIYFVIGTGLLLIWNFFIYSKFIWKKKK